MGPLVPEIVGNELNFVVALLIGVAFGFILEQAGFSTSKKLVGLFYGYDFTVLRVFFTGGVTAMLGVVALNHFGYLDVNLIYINPTFLWSAVVGGIIMGLGFVIGGYCPGTSVCAAAIGKIDAMWFVLGSAIGVFIFGEGYPVWEGLYKAENWGNVTMFKQLGISQSLFAFLLTFAAVFAFWATSKIQGRVTGEKSFEFNSKPLYGGLALIAIVIGLSTFAMPDRREAMMEKVNDKEFVANYRVSTIDSDELAFRLIDDQKGLQIWDFRSKKDYDSLPLPLSHNITMENLFENSTSKQFLIEGKINVIVAPDEETGRKAAVLASELGLSDVRYLTGGFKEFQSSILAFSKPEQPGGTKVSDSQRFRTDAALELPLLIKEFKKKSAGGGDGAKKPKRALGGC